MKQLFIGCLAGLSIAALYAFKVNYDLKNSSAEVNQVEGLYIFTDSKPVKEYEYLGTVKSNSGGFGDSQYTGVRSRIIKNCKKDFPKADGIILYLNSGEADKADAIKFK